MKKNNIENGWIQITDRCNLKCQYCYMDANKDNRDISLDQFKEIVKKFKVLGIRNVMLSGGEPCLHAELTKMIDYLHANQLGCGLVTNGTELSLQLVQCLERNGVSVQVSVDSVDKENYIQSRGIDRLDSVLHNIKQMLKYDIPISLSNTLNDFTVPRIRQVVEFAMKNSIHTLHFCFLIPSERCKKNGVLFSSITDALNELYHLQLENFMNIQIGVIESYVRYVGGDQGQDYFCNSMAGKNIEVLPNGDIYQCGALESSMNHVNTPNIYKLSGDELKVMLDSSMKRIGVDCLEGCISCDIKGICKGGCRAIPYQILGDIMEVQPLCAELHKFINGIIEDYKRGVLDNYLNYLKFVDNCQGKSRHCLRYF